MALVAAVTVVSLYILLRRPRTSKGNGGALVGRGKMEEESVVHEDEAQRDFSRLFAIQAAKRQTDYCDDPDPDIMLCYLKSNSNQCALESITDHIEQPHKWVAGASEPADSAREFARIVSIVTNEIGLELTDGEPSDLVRSLSVSASFEVGLKVAAARKWPPAFHQPKYVVLLSPHRVCVMVYAFIGTPLAGDRPSTKSTPFVIKIISPNLASSDREGGMEYLVRETSETSILKVINQDLGVCLKPALINPECNLLDLL